MNDALPENFSTEKLTDSIKKSLAAGCYPMIDPSSAKGKLINAATRLFKRKGFMRTTVRDIAADLGIQSGSLFHHFANKDEILKAVMSESIILNLNKMEIALAKIETCEQALQVLIRCELEAVNGLTSDAMSVLVNEWRYLSQEGQTEVLKLREGYESIWLKFLRQAKSEGILVGEAQLIRRLLLGSIGWTHNWYQSDGEILIEDLTDQILATIIRK